MKHIVIAIALAATASVGTAYRASVQHEPQADERGPEIPQPRNWVPFSADIRQINPGHPDEYGRFYRNSDGSTRYEMITGPIGVMIKNIPKNTFFKQLRGKWTSQPMQLPPEGWRPMRYHEHPRVTKLPGQIAGHVVYRHVMQGGSVKFLAPDLNFFAVITQYGNGRRAEYTNIVVGEPVGIEFEPPRGASVQRLTTPGGIQFVPESQGPPPGLRRDQ